MTPPGWNASRTRRWFLLRGIGVPVMAIAVEACARIAQRPEAHSAPSCGLGDEECLVLRSAVDELIPAGNGMPAASEVGSLEYLEQLIRDHSEVRGELETALARLATVSGDALATPFTGLSHPQRVHALSEMEKRAPREFTILRDYTYEAYYTRPEVWRLIGYDGHSTQDERWNDDALLAPVRLMPRLYRLVI